MSVQHIFPVLPASQIAFLEERIRISCEAQPGLQLLSERLDTLVPGTSFCPPRGSEEDLVKILDRGQFWDTSGIKITMMLGAPCQCHSNSARCWDANQGKCRIATGYALSDDGLWRQHTWLQRLPKRLGLVETTESRLAYYGFVMNEAECQDFYSMNDW